MVHQHLQKVNAIVVLAFAVHPRIISCIPMHATSRPKRNQLWRLVKVFVKLGIRLELAHLRYYHESSELRTSAKKKHSKNATSTGHRLGCSAPRIEKRRERERENWGMGGAVHPSSVLGYHKLTFRTGGGGGGGDGSFTSSSSVSLSWSPSS